MTILKKLTSVERLNVDSNMLLIYLARILEAATDETIDAVSDQVDQLTSADLIRNDIIET